MLVGILDNLNSIASGIGDMHTWRDATDASESEFVHDLLPLTSGDSRCTGGIGSNRNDCDICFLPFVEQHELEPLATCVFW